MARKVFFSFHYERDAWRAGQVRNSNVVAESDRHGFIDAVDWEAIERQGEQAIKNWIASQLNDTSATVVLIGAKTSERDWVAHEIVESWNRGNGIVGVYIHNMKDQYSQTDLKGTNPLDKVTLKSSGAALSSICRTYDWVADDGRRNMGAWIEAAVKARN
jgi:hypothetical protein